MLTFITTELGGFSEEIVTRSTEFGHHYHYLTLTDKLTQSDTHKHVAIFIDNAYNLWGREAAIGPIFHANRIMHQRGVKTFFHIYDTEASIDLAYDLLSEAIREHKELDAIITIGRYPSVAARDVRQILGKHIPHIFVGLEKPEEFRLLTVDGQPHNNTTGSIMVPPQYDKSLALLQAATAPDGRLLFLYDEESEHTLNDNERMYHIFKNSPFNVETRLVPRAQDKRAGLIKGAGTFDVVAFSNEALSLRTNVRDIVETCNHTSTTTFTNNSTSVQQGIVMGCGNSGYDYRSATTQQLVAVLKEISIDNIPAVEVFESSEVSINHEQLLGQGVRLSHDLEAALTSQSIYKKYQEIKHSFDLEY